MLLKADKSNSAPEVDELLNELGNTTAAIPYFGLFQPGEEPIHFDGVYLSPESFLDQLGADDLSKRLGNRKETLVDDRQQQPAPAPSPRVGQMPAASAN